MVDFDLTKMESELILQSSTDNYKCGMNIHGDDSGEAVIVRTIDSRGNGYETQLAINKKAARLVVNFLQTYFEL